MFKTVAFTKRNTHGGVLLLGGFDGLHVGHRQLLSYAKTYGLPVGIMTIVGGKDGSLFTLEEREQIFREAGADFVFELPFLEIKGLSPQEFVALLEAQFAPKAIVCGEDFRFGAGALGTAESLQALSLANVTVLPLIELEGSKVSSSTVKELIALGGLEKANAMLSRPFFLLGKVEMGRRIGRTIGFPTANMSYPAGKFLLPLGVYETRVLIDKAEYKAITNLGAQPTVGGGQVCVESFVADFNGDLYGKSLRVSFVRKIREIKKFESVEQLKAQLQMDLAEIR